MNLKLNDFDYSLPQELIAQYPAKKRTDSKLLIIDKSNKTIRHTAFKEFINYITKKDALVLNDTYVIAARLKALRQKTGAKLEVFIERKINKSRYSILVKPSKRAKEGDVIEFIKSGIKAKIIKDLSPKKIIEFEEINNLDEILEAEGAVPLPPYIKRMPQAADKIRYQTVYASKKGAVAAPTAGLHFDKQYLDKIKEKGVNIQQLTLHVSYGTFKPITNEDLEKKRLHEESFAVSAKAADSLNEIRKNAGRIFAVGTTSCRALESAADNGYIKEKEGQTDIFIYPPYRFQAVDALLTNFHLPKSSLLMLISAFLSDNENSSVREGHKLLMEAYRQAIERKYRFYSYGDAMLIF
jgi:S-adenosylmethionine:tRNA ribosyltransferase-isomerase